jgi:hypothetical protein
VSAAYVVGSTAVPQYPQASAPFQHDPVPDEMPLGYRIDDLNSSDPVEPSSFTQQATGEPADATPLAVERVGSPFSQTSGDPTLGSLPSQPVARNRVSVGPPVPYRRY